jgi:hypothetical protein
MTPAMPTNPPSIPCPRCGATGPHVRSPGKGPHHIRLDCGRCGAFLRWLSPLPPAECAARRTYHQREAVRQKPPTEAQLQLLARLGYHGPGPGDRLEAAEAIDSILKKGA